MVMVLSLVYFRGFIGGWVYDGLIIIRANRVCYDFIK